VGGSHCLSCLCAMCLILSPITSQSPPPQTRNLHRRLVGRCSREEGNGAFYHTRTPLMPRWATCGQYEYYRCIEP
ncbi:hypothetical protein B0I71DRAFT_128409, partial [Yarrowia lipolytica]